MRITLGNTLPPYPDFVEEQDTSDVKTLLCFYTGTNTGRFVKTDR